LKLSESVIVKITFSFIKKSSQHFQKNVLFTTLGKRQRHLQEDKKNAKVPHISIF